MAVTKTTKVKEKTKFTSKDIAFEVGDIVYQVAFDDGQDYSINELTIDQLKIAGIELSIDRIVYSTTKECEIVDRLNNMQSKNCFKTKEAALKHASLRAISMFDEKLIENN